MRRKYVILFVALVFLSISSCNKRVVPSIVADRGTEAYDSATFNYFYIEAIKQKLIGNEGDALKYLEQCIRINPESDASYYQMAQIVINSGDLKNGKDFASKALEIRPRNIWYLMMLAGANYQDNNIDSAIVYYEKAVEYFPEKENLQLILGNLYSEQRSFEKANKIFNYLDEKYGINESSTLPAIRNLMAEEKYDEALVKAKLLLIQYPDEILYSGLLAEIYRGKGESTKAMEVYKELIERSPDNPQTQLSLCNFLIAEKNYEDLFMLLNTVIINSRVTREDKISLLAQMIELPDLVSTQGNNLLVSLMVLEIFPWLLLQIDLVDAL